MEANREIHKWPKCREPLTAVVPHQPIQLQRDSYTQGSGETVEQRGEKLQTPEDRDVCREVVPSAYDREITLDIIINGCLNKTWTMITPEANLTWMEDYHKTPPLGEELEAVNGYQEGENWTSPGIGPLWVIHSQVGSCKYRQGTLNEISGL